MSISSDLDLWWVQISDYNESNAAKAKFQEIMWEIDEKLNELETMYGRGDFDKLPTSVKNKFVSAWSQLDAVRDTLKADVDFMSALNWTP